MSSGVLDAQGLTAFEVAGTSGASSGGLDGATDARAGAGAAIFSDSSCARAFHLLKASITKFIDDIDHRGS